MKAEQVTLYPLFGQDEAVIKSAEWIPEKHLLENVRSFSIYKSDPSEPQSGTIQYAVRLIEQDLMRIDSYREGYFAVNLESRSLGTAEFLQAVENHFAELKETLISSDEELTIGIFAPFKDPEVFSFERPLSEMDLNQSQIVKDVGLNGTSLLRIESPVGTFCHQQKDGGIGFISPIKFTDQEALRNAIMKFILQMQPVLPEDVISRVLEIVAEDPNQVSDTQ